MTPTVSPDSQLGTQYTVQPVHGACHGQASPWHATPALAQNPTLQRAPCFVSSSAFAIVKFFFF